MSVVSAETRATFAIEDGLESVRQIQIQCWSCATPITLLTAEPRSSYTCPYCTACTPCNDGIFHSLSPDRTRNFERFMAEYEFIRAAEDRGSLDSSYYLALPFDDLTGKLSEQWKIRACTFEHFVKYILTPLAARHKRPLNLLDLGAGNGWLSHRLSLLGHHPVAVDLLTNSRDGLGAAHHYAAHLPYMFPRIQADLNHLPFEPSTFDLAIFNASFHYSEDFSETLAEALRCVRPGAPVVVADTPWYRKEQSGLQMVEEKHAHFRKAYGFASNSIASREFLTPERLHTLANDLSLRWRILKPFHGLNWALRPLRAKLRGRRTPSKFHLFVAERSA